MPIRNRLGEMHADIAGWRRHLHANPELLFDTHDTAAFVTARLKEFGCDEVVTGIARTGVVGVIRGRDTGSGRVTGLRADMDALPIDEATGVPHASQNPGKMHACGHDGHTAMLLGAARYLAETRNFDGTAVVIFQPAEEGGGGGGVMVDEGLMDRFAIDEVYGMHNWPGLPVGQFAIREGEQFAASDTIEITISGQGGHGAMPDLAVDPVVAAAHVVTALQTIVSRNSTPVKPLVISVCRIESSGHAFNVIPASVRMAGTVRTMDDATRDLAEQRIAAVAEHTAHALGARAEVHYQRRYPALVNHPEQTGFAIDAARAVSGGCSEAAKVMGGEDFAFMLLARPGAYILTGNGDSAALHNAGYDFNDEAISAGASWWVEMAERRMPLAG